MVNRNLWWVFGLLVFSIFGCRQYDSKLLGLSINDARTIEKLSISEVANILPVGSIYQLVAELELIDDQIIDITKNSGFYWYSSDNTIVSVNQSGQIHANAIGEARISISGTVAGQTFADQIVVKVGPAKVVSLQLASPYKSIIVGLQTSMHATAVYSDGSTIDVSNDSRLAWSSSNPLIMKHLSGPLFEAVSAGSVEISVSGIDDRGEYFSGKTQLVVEAADIVSLSVSPSSLTIAKGLEQQFYAAALLTNEQTIDVSDNPNLHWSSSDETVIFIDAKGLAQANSEGRAQVTASGENNGVIYSHSVEVLVTSAQVSFLQISPSTYEMAAGSLLQMKATAIMSDARTYDVTKHPDVSWMSNNSDIVEVTSAHSGQIRAISTGEGEVLAVGNVNNQQFQDVAHISVTKASLVRIEIAADESPIPLGVSRQLKALAYFSDGSLFDITNEPSIYWVSSAPDIASVTSSNTSNNGLVTAKQKGRFEIIVTGTLNNITYTDTLALDSVSAAVVDLFVDTEQLSLPAGTSYQFTAKASLSDGNQIDVTQSPSLSWYSTNPDIASFSLTDTNEQGHLYANAKGETTVWVTGVTDGVQFKDQVKVFVTDATLDFITLSPSQVDVEVGKSVLMRATANYSDSSQVDVTQIASWSAYDPTIITVDKGKITGKVLGSTQLQVFFDDVLSNVSHVKAINSSSCESLSGYCLDFLDDGSGKLLTSSPSTLYLDSIGGSPHKTPVYDGVLRGSFYRFGKVQSRQLCEKYSAINLAGRINWRPATNSELNMLFRKLGNMTQARGWPTSIYYKTEGQYIRNLAHGEVRISDDTFPNYVSCVSEP